MSDSEEEFNMATDDKPEGQKKPKLKLKLSVAKPEAAPSSSGTEKKKKKKEKDSKKRKSSHSKDDKKPAAKKVKTESKNDGKAKNGSKKKLKELDKTERLTYAMQSFLWWDAEEPPEGCQWRTMEHAGVSFPESYVPHGVKMKYDGEEIELTPEQEEA